MCVIIVSRINVINCILTQEFQMHPNLRRLLCSSFILSEPLFVMQIAFKVYTLKINVLYKNIVFRDLFLFCFFEEVRFQIWNKQERPNKPSLSLSCSF